MSAHTPQLSADVDSFGCNVILRVDAVRASTLRTLAEAWSENPARVAELLDQLAAGLDRPVEGWGEAVIDFETDTQMDDATVELDEVQALQLADELADAARRTFSARSRTVEYLAFPHQQGEAA